MTPEEYFINQFKEMGVDLPQGWNDGMTVMEISGLWIVEMMDQYATQQIEDLELLIELNEDDFDRGKGKYILRDWIKKNRSIL